MDPDQIFTDLFKSIANYHRAEDSESALYWADDVIVLIEALDEWLSRGGFLPEAWNIPRSADLLTRASTPKGE